MAGFCIKSWSALKQNLKLRLFLGDGDVDISWCVHNYGWKVKMFGILKKEVKRGPLNAPVWQTWASQTFPFISVMHCMSRQASNWKKKEKMVSASKVKPIPMYWATMKACVSFWNYSGVRKLADFLISVFTVDLLHEGKIKIVFCWNFIPNISLKVGWRNTGMFTGGFFFIFPTIFGTSLWISCSMLSKD